MAKLHFQKNLRGTTEQEKNPSVLRDVTKYCVYNACQTYFLSFRPPQEKHPYTHRAHAKASVLNSKLHNVINLSFYLPLAFELRVI